MNNLFNLSEEEKNRIRGLHLTESKDKRITSVLSEQGATHDYNQKKPFDDVCITVNFESGRSEIGDIGAVGGSPGPKYRDNNLWITIGNRLRSGMEGDRPFINIEAGTSGTGSHNRNRQVMDERIDEALNMIIDKVVNLKRFEADPKRLRYSVPTILDKTRIDRNYSIIEPGSILPDGKEVPTDPNHPYFEDAQYVKICFSLVKSTPDYNSLADLFIKATKDDILGTDEGGVYSILQKMRDKEDFEAFQEELRDGMYKMDFYEVVCEGGVWPFGKVKELPRGDHHGIDSELRRLGVRPIPC